MLIFSTIELVCKAFLLASIVRNLDFSEQGINYNNNSNISGLLWINQRHDGKIQVILLVMLLIFNRHMLALYDVFISTHQE